MAKATSSKRSSHLARRRYPLWRLARANFHDLVLLLRESWIVLFGFVVLTLAGTLYLIAYQQLGVARALYETLKLLTFQSSQELPGDLLGEALFFLIPLLGLALIFQSVLNFGRLLLDKSSRREVWQVALAATYRDHVIVCGLGRVGLSVIAQLIESGYEPVVIERVWESEFVPRALGLKVPVVLGDARELATLRQAGFQRARAIIAVIHDDLTNIEIALTARAARPGLRVVLRVFSEELDQNLERGLGANSAFSASALAAPTYAAASISRGIDYVIPVGEELLGVSQLTIQPGSQLVGLDQAIEEQHEIRVLRHDGAAQGHARPVPTRPLGGDTVTLLGALPALEALRLMNLRGGRPGPHPTQPPQHPTAQYDTVIVCGLGKVGYRVVRQLYRMRPRPRIVVLRLGDGRADFPQHISRLDGVTTLIGDARDPELLRQAGIERAYSVAALTSDDLLNLQIGLAARRARPDIHVVLRVFSDVLADKLADMFGIRTIYSTSGLASPTLAAAAVLGDISHAFAADGDLFSTDQIVVGAGDPLDGRTVGAIRARHGGLVIALRRDGETTVLPALADTCAAGDEVTLLAPIGALGRVRAALARYSENTR
ncbi:MAG: NAD-binding protein [Kouleothrix sp.]|nr:NAD-binding protein [Kouleothrix sp.]